MKDTRLMILGGFFGSGKTSALYALGHMLQEQGKKVAIILYDQMQHLVDRSFFQTKGFSVFELTFGNLGCHFSGFSHCLSQLIQMEQPDVILAEPMGSCADLMATIIKPLSVGKVSLSLSPLAVLVDPMRLHGFISTDDNPFHRDDMPYLFCKQMEEADFIVLSQSDVRSKESLNAAQKQISLLFPQAKCLTVSAKTGQGLPQLLDALYSTPVLNRPQPPLDYDIYATAEAALAWLNLSCEIVSENGFSCDLLLQTLAQRIKHALGEQEAEIAHLKLCIYDEDGVFAKVSCIGLQEPVILDYPSKTALREGTLLINARAACTKERLLEIVTFYVKQEIEDRVAELINLSVESLSSPYPHPVFCM